jgi:integrase/recombinase XerC
MGRHANSGYTLRQQSPGSPWSVRFRLDGRRIEIFTGTRDRKEADRRARKIYAEALQGGRIVRSARGQISAGLIAEWLDALPVRDTTRSKYGSAYAVRWLRELPELTPATVAAYVRRRLGEVRVKSLRSELAALRSLVTWMHETGALADPLEIPSPPAGALGTPSRHRRRVAAPTYTPREVWAVIAALPARAPSGFWVRARCAFIYETTLRPSTVDRLEVPRHWSPGETELRITDDIDKEGAAREVPLSELACLILEACAPASGPIFGEHRYSHFVPDAAASALPPVKAAVFTPQHLRSAGATHRLERGAELPGLQWLMGHAKVSTTAIYIRASKAAAARAVGRNAGRIRADPPK